jgi:hypothetical protein
MVAEPSMQQSAAILIQPLLLPQCAWGRARRATSAHSALRPKNRDAARRAGARARCAEPAMPNPPWRSACVPAPAARPSAPPAPARSPQMRVLRSTTSTSRSTASKRHSSDRPWVLGWRHVARHTRRRQRTPTQAQQHHATLNFAASPMRASFRAGTGTGSSLSVPAEW